jgi:hypothetical protein
MPARHGSPVFRGVRPRFTYSAPALGLCARPEGHAAFTAAPYPSRDLHSDARRQRGLSASRLLFRQTGKMAADWLSGRSLSTHTSYE